MAQGSGKVESYLAFDLDLINPFQLIFYGVFHGYNLFVRGVNLVERPIEGGGLPASRGTSYEEYSIGLLYELIESSEGFRKEAELIEVNDNALLIENPHDHALAVKDWDG